MPLTAFQKAGFRQHTHSDDQIVDSESGEPGEGGGGISEEDHAAINHAGIDGVPAEPDPEFASINFVIDGAGSAIATGVKGDVQIDFACEIQSVTLLADTSGAIVVDIWNDTYANYPPTDADSITASAPATITASGTKSTDATLTGWDKAIAAGDVLRFNVDSVTSITRVTVALKVLRT